MSQLLQQTIGFRQPDGFPGQPANSNPITYWGCVYKGATPAQPGMAVKFGAQDETCDLFTDAADAFLGILMLKRDMVTGLAGQALQYAGNDAVGVMLKGFVWVTAQENVDAGDPVAVTATSLLGKTGVYTIPDARWMTTTAQNETGIVWLA